MSWTQYLGVLERAPEKAAPGGVDWYDPKNKKDWYQTPFENLYSKLRELAEGKAELEFTGDNIWIHSSEENDLWVRISDVGTIELGVPAG